MARSDHGSKGFHSQNGRAPTGRSLPVAATQHNWICAGPVSVLAAEEGECRVHHLGVLDQDLAYGLRMFAPVIPDGFGKPAPGFWCPSYQATGMAPTEWAGRGVAFKVARRGPTRGWPNTGPAGAAGAGAYRRPSTGNKALTGSRSGTGIGGPGPGQRSRCRRLRTRGRRGTSGEGLQDHLAVPEIRRAVVPIATAIPRRRQHWLRNGKAQWRRRHQAKACAHPHYREDAYGGHFLA